jgi:hypothetical protein
MKKLFVASLAVVALTACTKDYTCTCTYSSSDTEGYSSSSKDVTTLKGLTKAQAENECHSLDNKQTYPNDPSAANYVYNYSRSCTLSK